MLHRLKLLFNVDRNREDRPDDASSLPSGHSQVASPWQRLAALWARLAERVDQHRLYWNMRDELESLSDRALADKGLQRDELRGFVKLAIFSTSAGLAGPGRETPHKAKAVARD